MLRPPTVVLCTALLVTPPSNATAQAQPAGPRLAASSFVTTEVHINAVKIGTRWFEEDASLTGPARIAITYGQPHARGRKVAGGLIPLDTVWRFGANKATTLHAEVSLTLGGLKVPPGDYTLFVLFSARGSQLIVNLGTGQWGTERDAAKDLGRVPLTVRTMAEPEESLSVTLVPESTNPQGGLAELRGLLRIKWGTLELSAPWSVER